MENKTIMTPDLALAAYLKMKFPISQIDDSDPKRCVFHFEKSEKVEKEIESFWKGAVLVEPQAYFNSIKLVKNSLYGAARAIR